MTNTLSPSLDAQEATFNYLRTRDFKIIVQRNANYNKPEPIWRDPRKPQKVVVNLAGNFLRATPEQQESGPKRKTPLCREAPYLDLVTRWAPNYHFRKLQLVKLTHRE